VEIGNKISIPTCNTCSIFNVFNVCLKIAGFTGKRATTMAIFEFSTKPDDTEVSIFSQGDLTIIGTEGTVTTKDNPRYSMMIFVSIWDFMGHLQNFFLNENMRSSRGCEFDGVDGAFTAYILRENKRELRHMIAIKVFGKIISREPATQFIREFWQSVQPFVTYYRSQFKETDNPGIVRDLDDSMKEFAEAFADMLKDT
jgi:hypothetical protein